MLIRLGLILFIIVALLGFTSKFDKESVSLPMEQKLEKVADFINSNKNDSALIYLSPILKQLVEADQLDSPLGLSVQLAQAKALEQSNHHKEAILGFNTLKDKSEAFAQWEILVETCLALASLQEKLHRAEQSKQQLDLAQATIKQHALQEFYPALTIRKAFWHYSFGYPDSVLYFSKAALKLVQNSENPKQKIAVNILLGHSSLETNYEKAINYYLQAGELAKKLKDYTSLSHIWNIVTKVHMRHPNFTQAFIYNDSCIAACYDAIAAGHEKLYTLIEAYQNRAHLFNQLGQIDSAYHYSSRGLAQEVLFLKQQQKDQVIEIDARYNNEKKSMQLAQQTQVIQQGKKIRYLLIGLVLIIVAFASILTYYYIQLRRANQKTEKQAAQLHNMMVTKSHFFANVSHELRTPLTLLRGPIKSLLNEKQLSPKQNKLLQIANRSGQQLEQLINEILSLQKSEMGKLELKKEPTELNSFFQPFLAQFESLAQYKSLHFSYKMAFKAGETALIDREKYRQILYNLLSNAFKYTGAGGEIRMNLAIHKNHLILEVADNGPGIHPDDLPHLFDRYFQTNQPRHLAQGGTGIGLAICHEYTHLMGGEIQVESQLGTGALFTVSIPVSMLDKHLTPSVYQ